MRPEPPWLADAARAVADAEPLDWTALESRAGGADQEPILAHLRLVARIADAHRLLPFPQPGPKGSSGTDARADGGLGTWGPFALVEQVGRGAYGDVYRARDPRLDRDVAVKLLRPAPVAGSPAGPGVIEEARLLARVRHPHVVAIHGADSFDGRVGLWMEFIRGRSLEREVTERGPFSAAEAAVVGLDICRALAAVHAAGLVHRDVKAANIMREEGGRIVLMDFGAGRLQRGLDPDGTESTVGTPLYLAPEVLAGQPASPASDLYGLGVVLYHLVTGSYPVAGRTFAELREASSRGERRILRDERPDLPAGFVAVVERALAASPEDRFPSAGRMEAALAAAVAREHGHDEDRLAHVVPAAWKKRVALALVGLLLLVGVAAAVRWWPKAGSPGAVLGFQSRDWLLVTAFDNHTGNPRLDGAIEYALERELQNSRFVNVPPRERIGDALQLMRKPPDTRLDEVVGREVCLRDGGIRAMVTGRVDRLGGKYEIGARLVEPSTGETVLAAAVESAGEEAILTAVRTLAERIRVGLGEVRAAGQTLEPGVTTRSWKAWQLYSQGMALLFVFVPVSPPEPWRAAGALFEQATREDPEFASAYVYLSWTQQPGMPWGDRAKMLSASERAFQLSDHATERERLFIRGTYFHQRGKLDEARAEYEALTTLHADHYWALNNLSQITNRSDPEKALPYILRMAEIRPNGYAEQVAAADALIMAGRFDEANPYIARLFAVRKLLAIGIGFDWPKTYEVKKRWATGDVSGAWAALRELSAKAIREGDADIQRVLNPWFVTLGRLREADAFLLKQLEQAERQRAKPQREGAATEVLPEVGLAWNAELRGDRRTARAWIERLSRRVPPADRATWGEVILLQARMGLPAEMRRSLAESNMAKQEPYVLWAGGELALAEGRAAKAAALLTKTLAGLPKDRIRHGSRPAPMLAIQALASAVEATRGPQAALDVITSNVWPPDRTVTLQHMNASAWLELQARRARLLRRLGRAAEAELLETDLRKYLAYADDDLLMVRQVGR